jgi:prepilin-type processing-associated H-X9-DG protein
MTTTPSNDRLAKFFANLNKPLPGTSNHLVEILCVIVIVVILAGLCPCSCAMSSERGRRAQCGNNLRSLGVSFNLYAADHDETRPTRLGQLVKYVGGDSNVKMFMCPTATRILQSEAPRRISDLHTKPEYSSYAYLSTTGLVEGPVEASAAPLMCDKPGNHGEDGINILFADGHVNWWNGTIEDYAKANSLSIKVVTNWLD